MTRMLLMLVFMLTSLVTSASAQETAVDLIVTGAKIRTMEKDAPLAKSMAVKEGVIVAIGDVEAVSKLAGPNTVKVDLAGKTILPGFIDAHCHPRAVYAEDSPWASVECGPENIKSMAELIAALKRKAEKTPEGQWVNGSNYQETLLGRHPTRLDLDKASTKHPIMIRHSSGHRGVCNTLALTLAKVTKDTKNPPGGAIDRDEQGEPNGILKEGAQSIVRRAGPNAAASPSRAEQIAAHAECLRRFLAAGLTSVHVAGIGRGSIEILTEAQKKMPVRMYMMLSDSDEAAVRIRDKRLGDDWIRYGAVKMYHGNSLSGQTAWLSQPYIDRPDNFGVPPARSQKTLDEMILKMHRAGIQICVHSNGDREIEMLLTSLERALEAQPREDHRHRIEHCSVVTPEILTQIKKLGLVIAPHSYVYEHGDKMEAYGSWRWGLMHPNKSLLDLGVVVAGNSDYPVSAALPLLRVQDLVERKSRGGKVYGENQRITIQQALESWTIGSAYGGFSEKKTGSLKVGKLADFVVLAEDPVAVETGRIKDIAIERTYVHGKMAFEAKH